MDYAASIWDPVSIGDIRKLEMVQHKAARWARSCFSQTASVTKMRNKNVDIEFSEIGLIPSTRPSRRH